MLHHVLALFVLSLPALAQEPAPIDPAKKQTAITELTRAFDKEGSAEARAAAIARCHELVDPEIIAWVRKGLDDKEGAVQEAAITALGQLRHKDALDALHTYWKREKKRLSDDDRLYPLLIKEVGRHGDPSSLPLLTADPFDQRLFATAKARVLSIGNIRSEKSVEAILDMSKKVGVHRMDGLRQEMRLALSKLTGRDMGPNSVEWNSWWQDNKKGFEVSKTPQKLDRALEAQWNNYWGIKPERPEGEGDGEGGQGGGGRRRGRGGEGGGQGGGGGEGQGG